MGKKVVLCVAVSYLHSDREGRFPYTILVDFVKQAMLSETFL